MGGLVGFQRAAQIALDLVAGHTAILITELHTNAGGTVTLSPDRRYPDNFSGNRDTLCLFHQAQQHENFIAQLVLLGCGDKKTTVLNKLHISRSAASRLRFLPATSGYSGYCSFDVCAD